jgi:glycosyltransferase involved in cell wall biosynthesis
MSRVPKVRFHKLSVLMAAYNEVATLRRCVDQLLAASLPAGLQMEIVLVDDGSQDRTWEIATQLSAPHQELKISSSLPTQGRVLPSDAPSAK